MYLLCDATELFSDHHQLSIILDVLGIPTLDDFYAITSPRSREYIRALPFRKKKPFNTLFPGANPLVRCHDHNPGITGLLTIGYYILGVGLDGEMSHIQP